MPGIRPLFLPALVLLGALARAQDPPGARSSPEAVTVDDLRKWLYTLASPEFEGRGTGTEGFRKAAEFMRDQYKSLGLEPAGDAGADGVSFFQKVMSFSAPKIDDRKTGLTFHKGEQTVTVPCDRLGGNVSKGLSAKGDVVLVTTGDPAAIGTLELKDKIVLLLVSDENARERMNALRVLAERGAAATVLATHGPVDSKLQGRSGARGNRAMRGAQMMPALVAFGGEDFAKVLALAGVDPHKVSPPMTPLTGVSTEFAIALTESDAPAWNVCARLRDSDPKVADEYVVVGSHLDHLGKRGSTWFPGADDDGSGSTGVLALAHMFTAVKLHPRRSILFLNFCGEEMGLVGSRWFSEHPTIPLESMVGELQMDMIGRREEEGYDGPRLVNIGEKAEDNVNSLHLIGSKKLSKELHEICLQKNETAKFDLEWDQEGMFNRSDHANFGRMGVPIAFFFTGVHRDYHQTTDTPDKIDYPKLLRVVKYVYDIANDLAERDDRPHVDPELWDAYQGKGRATPAAPLVPPPPRKPGEGK
jgi:hypothetical protein